MANAITSKPLNTKEIEVRGSKPNLPALLRACGVDVRFLESGDIEIFFGRIRVLVTECNQDRLDEILRGTAAGRVLDTLYKLSLASRPVPA